ADHDIDRGIELLHDVDNGSRYTRTFIVVAGRKAAFMDQHDDGLDPSRLQLAGQRVHGLGLVLELQAGRAGWGYDAGPGFQRQADEGDRDAIEFPDLVRREEGLAGGRFDGGSCKIVECRTLEWMRPLAVVDGMTAAIL